MLLPALAFFASAVAAEAGVVLTASPLAPIPIGSDQFSLDDSGTVPGFDSATGGSFNSNHAYGDHAVGQIFTTGSAPEYTLDAFVLKGTGDGCCFDANTTWAVRISTVSDTAFTPIVLVMDIAHDLNASTTDWITWTFSGTDLLTLNGSTTFAFETRHTGGGYYGFDASAGDAYLGGTAFNSQPGGAAGEKTFAGNGPGTELTPFTLMPAASEAAGLRSVDRTFVARLTAVPEPTTFALFARALPLVFARRRVN